MNVSKMFLAAATLAVFSTVGAESVLNTVDRETRAQMTALVEAWIDAEVQSDGKALEEILHENFLSTFPSGTTLDRPSYIDFIVGLDIPPFKVENQSMVRYGDTVLVIDISEDGATKFTYVAVRRDDQWKVISQTFSNVEASVRK